MYGIFFAIDEGQSKAYISDCEKKRTGTAMVGNEGPFLFADVPVNPDLSSWDEAKGIAIASLGKVRLPRVAYMGTIYKNNPETMGTVLSQVFFPDVIARRPRRIFVGRGNSGPDDLGHRKALYSPEKGVRDTGDDNHSSACIPKLGH